ncbi:DnaJ [Acrasis kona]|uniref:DnaJ n=1 Tax=Acrasis kona TaxID=1008807 RepID=A0AAW2Z0V6_9EUKA
MQRLLTTALRTQVNKHRGTLNAAKYLYSTLADVSVDNPISLSLRPSEKELFSQRLQLPDTNNFAKFDILAKLGDWEQIERMATIDPEKTEAEQDEDVRISNLSSNHIWRGVSILRQNRIDEAFEEFSVAQDLLTSSDELRDVENQTLHLILYFILKYCPNGAATILSKFKEKKGISKENFDVLEHQAKAYEQILTKDVIRNQNDILDEECELLYRIIPENWQTHYINAIRALTQGELQYSLRALLEAEDLVADYPTRLHAVLNLKSFVLAELGRHDEAKETLQRYVLLNPQENDLLTKSSMVSSYNQLGQYEKVIETVNNILELYPDSAANKTQRGYAYMSLGRREEALKDFNDVKDEDPRAFLYSARLAQDSNEALEQLTKYCESQSDDPLGWYLLAEKKVEVALKHVKDFEKWKEMILEGQQAAEKALKIDKDHLGAIVFMAETERLVGNFRSCEEYLKRARLVDADSKYIESVQKKLDQDVSSFGREIN